jgi:hypothetical protein
VQLAFYSGSGAPLAVASFQPLPVASGAGLCSLVSMTINGREQQPPLLALWYQDSGLARFPPLLTRLERTLDITIRTSAATTR